jgi:hypothetical protein
VAPLERFREDDPMLVPADGPLDWDPCGDQSSGTPGAPCMGSSGVVLWRCSTLRGPLLGVPLRMFPGWGSVGFSLRAFPIWTPLSRSSVEGLLKLVTRRGPLLRVPFTVFSVGCPLEGFPLCFPWRGSVGWVLWRGPLDGIPRRGVH